MALSFKELVDNNIKSYNNYTPERRPGMIPGIAGHVDKIDKTITSLYQSAEKKKYPLRNSSSADDKLVGEQKRISAMQFVNTISPGITNGSAQSERMLLNEIKNAINRDDRDYAQSLIDMTELIPQKNAKKSNFYNQLLELKKKYELDVDVIPEVKELESRRAEFMFIVDAIAQGDEYIILPREFDEYFSNPDIKNNRDPKIREAEIKFVPFVNRSLSYLSKKGVNVKL